MTDQPAPEKIKAYLDEIVGASYRHGISIDGSSPGFPNLIATKDDFAGYIAGCDENGWAFFPATDLTISAPGRAFGFDEGCHTKSIDLTKLSNHERIKIHGTKSPDIAQMMRDAFMAGARAVVEHRKDVYTEEWWWDGYEGNVEDEAPEYAAKIIGGQG